MKQSVFDKIGKVESRQSVFNRLGASPKEVKRKPVHERLGPVTIIKKHTKSPLSLEPSKEIKSAIPSRMRREADVNILCGEVLKVRPKVIVHTSLQEENEESMESSYATYQNGKDVEAVGHISVDHMGRRHFEEFQPRSLVKIDVPPTCSSSETGVVGPCYPSWVASLLPLPLLYLACIYQLELAKWTKINEEDMEEKERLLEQENV
nr:uncharacterized protein LOC109150426 [Ipomoea batatas]